MESLPAELSVPQDQSRIEHFPTDKGALEIASALEAGLESFKSGEIILKGLSAAQIRQMIGIDKEGESAISGLRFKDEEAGIESNPNFAGKNPLIDKDDPKDSVSGVVKVSTSEGDHNIDLLVEKFNLGSYGLEYSLRLIPGVTMDEVLRHRYLSLVSENLKRSGV